MAEQIIDVHFGGESTNYLSLVVRGRAYHRSLDYWDGNWLHCHANIVAGKFTGSVPGLLRAEELERFRDQLEKFQHSLTGVITFDTMEAWLTFHIQGDKLGHLEIVGEIRDNVGYPYNTLTFSIMSDQTFLALTLQQLKRVVEAFPVVGSR